MGRNTHQRELDTKKEPIGRSVSIERILEDESAGAYETYMDDLNYELKQLCRHNRDGSFATQADRERLLDLIANQLKELGYRHMRATSLKAKHVTALVDRWHAEAIAPGTFKNRMTALRWACEKTGKIELIARSNDAYQIPRRVYVSNASKAWVLDNTKLAAITDPYTAMSLKLQQAFGLRREESIKIEPAWADRGDRIVLRDSWTKGGRSREIPICNAEQRTLLDLAKLLVGRGSLIPRHLRYIDQCHRFKAQIQKAGIRNVHGLRHHYAQARYQELTGWDAPAAGGPHSRDLSAEQKAIDREARLTISCELRHEREQVTTVLSQVMVTLASQTRSSTAWGVRAISALHRRRYPSRNPRRGTYAERDRAR